MSNYPQNFDFQKDAEVDALAKEAAEDIQSAANSDRIEYAVFIWQDNLGGLNRSSLQTANRPSPAYDPAITTPQSMGFDSWSQVVGVLHNHPTLYNAGNETNPIWQPQSVPEPSNGDMYAMNWFVTVGGADRTVFREYLLHGTNLNEYYHFDQDYSNLNFNADGTVVGGPADWAKVSSDFHGDIGWVAGC